MYTEYTFIFSHTIIFFFYLFSLILEASFYTRYYLLHNIYEIFSVFAKQIPIQSF